MQHIILGVIYRPPGPDVNQFNDITNDILERVRHERKLCYLSGHYNIDLLKHGTHKPTSELLDMLYARWAIGGRWLQSPASQDGDGEKRVFM